jgi:histidine triad (HIT) family protein
MESDNLESPTNQECAFCAYLRGDRPFTILDRSTLVATLITREQRGSSHVLVMPTNHRDSILDLRADEASAVMAGVIRAAKAIDAADRRPGISIWQNNGVPAHQEVPHVHFHVAGTLPGGGTDWGEVRELSLEETEAIAERLRLFLP